MDEIRIPRICLRCQSVNSMVNEGGDLLCLLCGARPLATDPGEFPRLVPASQLETRTSGHGAALRAASSYDGWTEVAV